MTQARSILWVLPAGSVGPYLGMERRLVRRHSNPQRDSRTLLNSAGAILPLNLQRLDMSWHPCGERVQRCIACFRDEICAWCVDTSSNRFLYAWSA